MVLTSLILYFVSFVAIWLGAGLIVQAVDRFSKKLHISSFAISFFVLGILTSIPEFAVGLTSVSEGKPEIFVGNLVGGIAAMFLFIIPALAIMAKGIKLKNHLGKKTLIFFLLTMCLPAFLLIDKHITDVEGVILLVVYGCLFYLVQRGNGIFEKNAQDVLTYKRYSFLDIGKVLAGVGIVFISSNIIVDKTLFFSNILGISPFYISLLFLSLGTNLPEFSIAVRSVLSKKTDIAFGDYLGSAAANVLLFGVLTLLHGAETIRVEDSFLVIFFFLLVGLGLFFYFCRTANTISRKEALILLFLYLAFFLVEGSLRK